MPFPHFDPKTYGVIIQVQGILLDASGDPLVSIHPRKLISEGMEGPIQLIQNNAILIFLIIMGSFALQSPLSPPRLGFRQNLMFLGGPIRRTPPRCLCIAWFLSISRRIIAPRFCPRKKSLVSLFFLPEFL
jgi:hypothetical protein